MTEAQVLAKHIFPTSKYATDLETPACSTTMTKKRRSFCQCKSTNDSGSLLVQKQCQNRGWCRDGQSRAEQKERKKIMMK